MKRVILLLLILTNTFIFSTQANNPDSLVHELNHVEKDSTQLEMQYKTAQKEKENKLLRKQNKIKTLALQKQKIITIGIGITLLLFIMLTYVFFRGKRKEKKAKELLRSKNNEILSQKEEIYSQSEELKTANENLEKLTLFKEGLTGMLIHDLKNHLNIIMNIPGSYSKERKIDIMKESANRMLGLVSDILDVQKHEDTELRLDIREHNLPTIVNRALAQVKHLLMDKNISLVNKVVQEYPVSADGEILERVLVNLFTNAIKYSPQNSNIEVFVEEHKDQLKVNVKDYGPGIPKHKKEIIFDKYGQIYAKKSGMARSTGIGLAFCSMAIKAHGQNIDFDSKPGQGTIFWFTLNKANTIQHKSKPIEIKETNSELTVQAKKILTPFYNQLSEADVFEVTKIRKILAQVNESNNNDVKKWKGEMEKAIFYCNSELFNHLIHQIKT